MILKDLIAGAAVGAVPTACANAAMQVETDRATLEQYIATNPDIAIYGINTFPGHRDEERVPPEEAVRFQYYLIENHAIGDAPYYPTVAARCMTLAKLHQIAAGGSLVSGDLYRKLLGCAEDGAFAPQIPSGSSYSSGDVIPAAHWARDILAAIAVRDPAFELKPGEGMALINGSFVHTGLSAYTLSQLRTSWAMIVETLRMDAVLTGLSFRAEEERAGGDLAATLAYISRDTEPRAHDIQLPVSFRAIPEIAATLHHACASLAAETEAALSQPSGNPLMVNNFGAEAPVSQASFLAPMVTVATTAVVEALLFALWSVGSRTSYLLSGDLPGVARDGAVENDPLAFIQWPKYMQAILEDVRLRLSRLAFASGSATSYGTEDLWTFGTQNLERLLDCLPRIQHFLATGMALRAVLVAHSGATQSLLPQIRSALPSQNAKATLRANLEAMFESDPAIGVKSAFVV
ncbi:MAG: hypothetical protein CVT72_00070 [Alphaproteobacteria bacterium HGW-Alphaproteobacteria-11]|nr:MAG: hypothetical protein CVT72_00070 [Alphaproteobacteria bacterium HGW-Alphaproteobacteria-11]